MSKAQERTDEAVGLLREWQGLEREAIETTAEIMEQTDNLLIRQIMEIIRNDSVQHHRVQQFINGQVSVWQYIVIDNVIHEYGIRVECPFRQDHTIIICLVATHRLDVPVRWKGSL